jgi:hypoxanthine phosphoribosyltransferase
VSAVLVRKKHNRCIEGLESDYVGLEVEDRYVFGFGMDYQSQLRHLNGIYALSE